MTPHVVSTHKLIGREAGIWSLATWDPSRPTPQAVLQEGPRAVSPVKSSVWRGLMTTSPSSKDLEASGGSPFSPPLPAVSRSSPGWL